MVWTFEWRHCCGVEGIAGRWEGGQVQHRGQEIRCASLSGQLLLPPPRRERSNSPVNHRVRRKGKRLMKEGGEVHTIAV